MNLAILEPFRPVLGAESYDEGGREVVGWIHCPRWRAIKGWVALLVERNMQGCLPFATNPEPWPGYYWAIKQAESCDLNSSWTVNKIWLIFTEELGLNIHKDDFFKGYW